LSDHTGDYIQALNKLLAKADFETTSEGLNSLCSHLGVIGPPTKGKTPMITARAAVFRLINSSLQQTFVASAGKDLAYPYFQLLAKALGIFLARATDPSTSVTPIQRYIRDCLPPSLSK
jgi:hypothetical protein